MKWYQLLEVRGGRKIRQILGQDQFPFEQVRTISGASGGPKFLVLNGLDQYLIQNFFPKLSGPVQFVGSSIGAWRSAAFLCQNPLQAYGQLTDNYIHQRYTAKAGKTEITAVSQKVLGSYLTPENIDFILNHTLGRLNVFADRAKNLVESENPVTLSLGLIGSFFNNLTSKKGPHLFFERQLFSHPEKPIHFDKTPRFDYVQSFIGQDNLFKVLQASGAIPGYIDGVKIAAADTTGVYRDGGLMTYHLNLPYKHREDEIVLFPHFFSKIVPGWFDKFLKKPRTNLSLLDNVLMVNPSPRWVDSLPMKKIPDRSDFKKMSHDQRVECWTKVSTRSSELADALDQMIHDKRRTSHFLDWCL